MKNKFLNSIKICLPVFFAAAAIHFSRGQDEIQIQKQIDVLGQTKPIPVSLEGFSGEVADVLKFDLYVQGFSFVAPGRRAISNQRQQRGQCSRPRRGLDQQTDDAFAQLHRRGVAAAGARVCRRHRAGHHRQKRHRADQNRLQGRSQPAATAKFTSPILTATTRKPSRTTTPSLPRRPGCRAGWRFITRRTSSATRTFFTTTSAPASAGSSRVIPA